MLIEHETSVKKHPATLYELDEEYFEAPTEEWLVRDTPGSEAVG